MSTIRQQIVDICLSVVEMQREEIGDDDEFSSFAHIDSLKALDLMTAIERHFAIKLPERALREFETINKVVAAVAPHLPQPVAA